MNPGDLSQKAPDTTVGREILWRLLLPHAWIHRRVETVRFLDEDTLRRSVSVDCEVEWSGDAPVTYFPIARIEKRPLTSFDLRDEGGRALPVLTTSQNGFLAWSALVAAAEVVLEAEVPRSIQTSLRGVAFADPRFSSVILEVVQNTPIDRSARKKLLDSPGVQALVENLAAGFLLITPIPAAGKGRRILKYAYSQTMERDVHAPIRQSLGLDPLSIDFQVPLVGEAQGYHLECEVPNDLQIATAKLVATVYDDQKRECLAIGQGERVHVFISNVDPLAEGLATVSLMPSAVGMLRATTLSTAAIFMSLALGALFSHRIGVGSDAAAALLLLVPGVLGAAISRPGEHSLASLILRGLRWCVAVACGCSFTAAGLIALRVQGAALRWGFLGLGFMCGGCLILACLALRAAHAASRRRNGDIVSP